MGMVTDIVQKGGLAGAGPAGEKYVTLGTVDIPGRHQSGVIFPFEHGNNPCFLNIQYGSSLTIIIFTKKTFPGQHYLKILF
jgi:hypothetical protein